MITAEQAREFTMAPDPQTIERDVRRAAARGGRSVVVPYLTKANTHKLRELGYLVAPLAHGRGGEVIW